MTRLTKTSLFALLGLTVVIAGANDASACGRRGGGYGGAYGGGYNYGGSYPSYHRTSYSRPVYRQPVQQPVQPIQQPVQQQPVPQQQFVQRQPVQQQPVQRQAVQQPAATQQAVQQQQPATQQQPLQTAQTQPQSSAASAEQTALELLSQFGGVETTQPEPAPEPQPQAFNGVGSWSATLGNGAAISLDMRADGSFTWTATKSGKQSTFSGTFALDGESLTLIRNDQKQLDGTLISPSTNGFTFKLDGVKDTGLQFARS